jgi:hypothetical protein
MIIYIVREEITLTLHAATTSWLFRAGTRFPPSAKSGERIDYNKGRYLISPLTTYQYNPPTYQL